MHASQRRLGDGSDRRGRLLAHEVVQPQVSLDVFSHRMCRISTIIPGLLVFFGKPNVQAVGHALLLAHFHLELAQFSIVRNNFSFSPPPSTPRSTFGVHHEVSGKARHEGLVFRILAFSRRRHPLLGRLVQFFVLGGVERFDGQFRLV